MGKQVYRVLSWGGLGDALMVTPSFKALKEKHPDCTLIVYCDSAAHWDTYRHNPHIDHLRKVSDYRSVVDVLCFRFKWRKFIVPNYGWFGPTKIYTKQASNIIAEYFGLTLANDKPEVFLTEAEEATGRQLLAVLPNPVVINPTSRSSKNQEWFNERWEAVIRALPTCTFVQLGLTDEYALQGAVDLRGTLSLRESMAVVKYSKGVVGVDSFFGHVARALDRPAVTLFGASNPEIWGYQGQANIDKKVPCAPCIDVLMDEPCPYNRKCMQQIEIGEVTAAIMTHLRLD